MIQLEVLSPPINKRRISVFDQQHEVQETEDLKFPEKRTEITYPSEYIEKVQNEIALWKMHVTKTLQEKQKFKAEKLQLCNTTVYESILSAEQNDIILSFNFEEYVRRVKQFCSRTTIIVHKIQWKSESEIEKTYLITQNNITNEIIRKHTVNNM